MSVKPLFSILHTSARPDKWRAVYDDWMAKATHPEQVEYTLCIDPRWEFSLDPKEYDSPLDNILVVQNTGRRCYVDGVNIAAKASSGAVLIVNADDQFACERWDEELTLAAIGPYAGDEGLSGAARELDATSVLMNQLEHYSDESWVIDVNVGTPSESAHKVCQMPILSRARYEAQGSEVFYHGYESMCADNDFREWAVKDGVLIDAYHLYFPHHHPLYSAAGHWQAPDKVTWDEAYQAQNSKQAHEIGVALLERRRASGFSATPRKRSIALCITGEQFHGVWVDNLLALYGHLINRDFEISVIRAYTSNVYVTREDIRRELMKAKPDMCLWWDDDNPVSPAHFDKLLADLDAHEEADGISGWCWIHNEKKQGFMVSCGHWSPDHLHWDPLPASFANSQALQSFEVGGFPCILMRFSALEKAGEGAFLPVLDNRLEHGIMGEDFAFFLNAGNGGAKFLVDPSVRVPHIKSVEVEPVFPNQGKAAVKVACMMRVKNEARWIKRTIDSVRELCGADVYVLEDGSIDDTRAIAEAAGAIVLPSPFVGMGLDEARDKNWLYAEVMARCSPDWVLMPDGDEELEPGGCAKIRNALETNPPCDAFALRFLYFWDSIETVRVDGVYGKMQRQSLFRADAKFTFKSYYSEDETQNQNHVGLHTSNAPGLGGRVMSLNVALLHYGYLHQADRIRKYLWILTVDPHNEGEGFYEHCVQGDLPEFPAEAVLKHGGPLKLQALPQWSIPKFEGPVPGPWLLNEATSAESDSIRAWRLTKV